MQDKKLYIRINGTPVEVTEEVYLFYYRSKRRDRYYEHDIKTGVPIRDEDGNVIGYTPTKEDSLERLIATGEDFADEHKSVEDTALGNIMSDDLHQALDKLSEQDRTLIDMLFFQGMTERQTAAVVGLSQKGVNKRKAKILATLKEFLEG